MHLTYTTFDSVDDLDSVEVIAIYLDEALKANDAAYLAHALGVAVRAKGIEEVALACGLSGDELLRECSAGGHPTLKTLLAVSSALGIKLIPRRLAAH
ncbi:addiction module antidote protein [Roseateles noduli]|uniref:addiction module antidote protein n=1 Tax=Roseateles noduli TaxID=2052484 RepID=UPI003D6619F3